MVQKQKKKEQSGEIPMNEDWHIAVQAMRVQKKPLFFVNTVTGQTVDVTLSKALAFAYITKSRAAHQFRVYEQTPSGELYLCQR